MLRYSHRVQCRTRALVACAIVSLAATAIGPTTNARTEALNTVTLQLKGTHQFQFAGDDTPIDQAFPREEGLESTLRETGDQPDWPGEIDLESALDEGSAFITIFFNRIPFSPTAS